MKRIAYLVLLVLLAAGAVSAQQWGPGCGPWGKGPGYGPRRHAGPGPGYYRGEPQTAAREPWETLTLTGTLELIDGNIALQKDAVTYYIIGLNRLVGFIDGLTEGAAVTLEGASRPVLRAGYKAEAEDGERHIFLASKLEINGKTYDNLTPALTNRPENEPRSDYPPPRRDQHRRYDDRRYSGHPERRF
jgi:hypothetical protein